MNYPRRTFLTGSCLLASGIASTALLGTRALGQGKVAVCYNPDADPSGQSELRKSLEYTEHSGDAKRRCDHCAFSTFTASGCGSCQMFSGGPVNPGGVCTSFAPKS